eukprot:UN26539
MSDNSMRFHTYSYFVLNRKDGLTFQCVQTTEYLWSVVALADLRFWITCNL